MSKPQARRMAPARPFAHGPGRSKTPSDHCHSPAITGGTNFICVNLRSSAVGLPLEILAIQGLSKKFGDTVALDQVDFNLRAGEVHCLVGENGAGKSTLIKILAGAERPDSGSITAFGQTHSRFLPQQSLEAGIATIYQDVELITSLTVADNIFLGRELRNSWGLIDASAQNRKTARTPRPSPR
jgi:ABC-type uncharacterized transport system ATPase subunit